MIFHVDGAQYAGKVPLNVEDAKIDLLSISAHKIYGPKGVGALYVRNKNPHLDLNPLMRGGGQERGLRPGTLNVPGIVGLGEAARIAQQEMAPEMARAKELKLFLVESLKAQLGDFCTNGDEHCLPGTLHISFQSCDPESLKMYLHPLAVSAGSACSSSLSISHVLEAIGLEPHLAKCSVRIGIGRFTHRQDLEKTLEVLVKAIKTIKKA